MSIGPVVEIVGSSSFRVIHLAFKNSDREARAEGRSESLAMEKWFGSDGVAIFSFLSSNGSTGSGISRKLLVDSWFEIQLNKGRGGLYRERMNVSRIQANTLSGMPYQQYRLTMCLANHVFSKSCVRLIMCSANIYLDWVPPTSCCEVDTDYGASRCIMC